MVDVVRLDELPPHDPEFVACGKEDSAELAARAFGFTNVPATVSAVTRLVSYLDKWGVKYRLVAGYQTRGRPSGGFAPRGYLIHHTASTSSASNPRPSLRTVVEGRSDLPGPLCQVATDYNGITDVVALGRANHAGAARAYGSVPSGDGNELWLGNEVMTSGSQRMPKAQFDAIVRVGAAVMDMLGVPPSQVPGHVGLHASTSVTGKWDLGAGDGSTRPHSLTPIHAGIVALLKVGPTGADDMSAAAEAQISEILALLRALDSKLLGRYSFFAGKANEVAARDAQAAQKTEAIAGVVAETAGTVAQIAEAVPDRFYTSDAEGVARQVPPETPGARRAMVGDQLDLNVIRADTNSVRLDDDQFAALVEAVATRVTDILYPPEGSP